MPGPTIAPPRARKQAHVTVRHGVTLSDDYHWLRAANWQEVMRDPSRLDAAIRAHLEAENAYTEAVMAPTAALRERLFAEMKGRIKEDDSSVPSPDGPYAYATRYVAGGQQPLIVRTLRDGGGEHVLLDGNREAEGRAHFRLGSSDHSPDHRLLAWTYDDTGSEFYTLHVRETASGRDLADEIGHTAGGAVWSADGRHLFYIRLDDNHRPSKLFRHEVGTPPGADVLVHEEKDPGFFMGVGKTQSDRFIVIHCHDHETSEAWLIAADRPLEPPRLVAARDAKVEYAIEEAHGLLYILTNAEGAEDFKIATAPLATPAREHWRDLVPHRAGTLVLAQTAYARHLVRLERASGLPRIVVRRLADGAEHEIAFTEEAYSLGLVGGYEFDTDILRFSYSSMTTPAEVYDYDMETRARTLRKRQEVPSGHDPARYVTRRIMAQADDGAEVPVTLLYLKDTPFDGSSPCWLYGYGSYGITIPAAFNTNVLSLVDRGFVYAVAHVRGGKDKGQRWYLDGKREKKVNTFTDFIAAARHLIAAGVTARGRIVAQGGSAGGMLMGAVANMAPELFAAVIAEVPFVDVLNTMLDDTLPLTPPEWQEWGNPVADEKAFASIAAYSPYDNVKRQAYPHILAVAGLADPRVTYWEAAKWVARLRELKTDDRLLLLKTHMEAGHAGSPGRFDRLKEVAFAYAFGLMVTGKAEV
jgi:oligopeptidase B